MLDRKYMQSIGLTDEQIELLQEGIDFEKRYFRAMIDAGVPAKAADLHARMTRSEDIDFSDEELLRLKIREEWDLNRKVVKSSTAQTERYYR